MRYMGIDYGRARVGVAVSDPNGKIAFPKGILDSRDSDSAIGALKKMIPEEKVERIIVGLPLAHDGGETGESRAVRAFARVLKEKISVPVEFENEIFTTRMATHEGVKKKDVDAASAAIILQSYLDRRKS